MTKRTVKTVYAVALATLIALLIALPTISYAIFQVKSDAPHNNLPTGTFQIGLSYGFVNNGVVDSYTLIDSTAGGVVGVDIHNPNATNHISKLRLKVDAESNMDSVMRIMVSNIWKQTDANGNTSVPRLLAVKFLYNTDNFIDNTRTDACFYYCVKSQYTAGSLDAYTLNTPNGVKSFELISGIDQDMDIYEPNVSLSLYIRPYIVQSNRFSEHWQITQMPLPV